MDIKNLIEEYLDFLRKGISYRQLEKGYEITTPFLDDNNDCIQIYVDDIKENEIILSDEGVTFANLEDGGLKLNQTRKQLLYMITRAYGVDIGENNCLTVKSTIKDFAQKKHALLQAILKVNDMIYTTQSRVASMFVDDIATFFDNNSIYNIPSMSVRGKTGFVHTYDFVLAKDRDFPERFCSAINRPSRSNITSTIFGWTDTLPQRKQESKCIVFLNDDNKISSTLVPALQEYGIKSILKSNLNTEETMRNFKTA